MIILDEQHSRLRPIILSSSAASIASVRTIKVGFIKFIDSPTYAFFTVSSWA